MASIVTTSRVLIVLVLMFVVAGCGEPDVADQAAPSTDATGDGHDHDHSDESRVREWDTESVPSITVSVTTDGDAGHVLWVEAPGFTFTSADVFDPVPGQGHAHLYVDGELMTMIYDPEFRLPRLDPGTYQLMVTLSTNDHLEYTVGGETLSAMTSLVIEEAREDSISDSTTTTEQSGSERIEVTLEVRNGTVHTDHAQIEVDLGVSLVLTVTSDVPDEVHIHGYDHRMRLDAGEPASIEFETSIPGIFEIELEGSHLLLVELRVG